MQNQFIDAFAAEKALDFFAKMRAENQEIFTLSVYRRGELWARAAAAPYDCVQKSQVYSLSKSFTSTAVGLAVAEGLLSLDDPVVRFFPPEECRGTDARMRAMTIRHLLSMNTGHAACTMPAVIQMGPRGFFEAPQPFDPGSHFLYNTGASYMLSEILQRQTGLRVLEYLTPRLFEPLGIEGAAWDRLGEVDQGGTGLHISCDDMAKFGLLYQQDGVWQGERLLPAGWAAEATAAHSDNSANHDPDWRAGYGYQFWRNARGGYRGDGAFGQLCVVLPTGWTAAVRANVAGIQNELDHLLGLLDSLEGHIPEGAPAEAAPPPYPPAPYGGGVLRFAGMDFVCEENPIGVERLRVEQSPEGLTVRFAGAAGFEIRAGAGRWATNAFRARCFQPGLFAASIRGADDVELAACCETGPDEARVVLRYRSVPHVEEMRLRFDSDGVLTLERLCGAELCCDRIVARRAGA